MSRIRPLPVLLVLLVACSDREEGSAAWEEGGSFVADDAGRIPLTTPGTAPIVERPVIGLPLPPLEEVPAAVAEDPMELPEVEPATDDTSSQRRGSTPPRQPGASDSVIPLTPRPSPRPAPVTPPAPPATPTPAPAPPANPVPESDTGGAPAA